MGSSSSKNISGSLKDLQLPNNVKLSTTLQNNTIRPFPIYLIYKNKELKPTNLLGYGGFGDVIEYSNNDYKFAIKITRDIEEVKAIKLLETYNDKCKDSIIQTRIIGKIHENSSDEKNPDEETFYVIGMHIMGDNLEKLLKRVSKSSNLKKLEILQQLTLQLICFRGIGLYYTDIKLNNILYNSNTKKFVFGDFGSMTTMEDNNYRGDNKTLPIDIINDNLIISLLFIMFFSEFYPNCVDECFSEKMYTYKREEFISCECFSLLRSDTLDKTIVDKIYNRFTNGCYTNDCNIKTIGKSRDDSNEGFIDLKLAIFVKDNLLLLQKSKLTMYEWLKSLNNLINKYYKESATYLKVLNRR